MTKSSSRPTFSISIEWENARFAEIQRTRRMLHALRAQLIELEPKPATPPEILLLYDRNSIDGELVKRVVAEDFRPDELPVVTRIMPTEGLRYYQQKIAGARASGGEIKIFLDCDVVPEPGWLAAILDAFSDPRVDVVAGETYLEQVDLYSRAFALFWFFPLRDAAEDLRPATFFHANNVAFRAAVFAAHPFPELDTYRGQCSVLGDTLRDHGFGLFVQKRARVSHPCPLGPWYFVARALNNGRDQVLVTNIRQRRNRSLLRSIYWNYRSGLVRSFRKFREHGSAVGLGPLGKIFGYGVATSYFTLKAIGELITHYKPDLIPRMFKV